MKIKDFIEGRNVTYQTVRKYIMNHPELFNGHIGKANNIVLDDIALHLLEDKYPFPEPVQVIHDKEARDKLQEITEKYAAAMEKITALTEQNAQLLVIQSKQRFLEEENESLSDMIDERDRELQHIKKELEKAEADNGYFKRQLQTLEFNYALEKEKPWWKKLIGK